MLKACFKADSGLKSLSETLPETTAFKISQTSYLKRVLQKRYSLLTQNFLSTEELVGVQKLVLVSARPLLKICPKLLCLETEIYRPQETTYWTNTAYTIILISFII